MNIEIDNIVMICESDIDIDPSVFENDAQSEFCKFDMEIVESISKISNKSIQRLSKKCGIHSLSTSSYNTVRQIIQKKLYSIIRNVIVIRDEKQTKIISLKDIEMAIDKNII